MTTCNSCPSSSTCSKDKDKCMVQNNPYNKVKKVIGVMSGKGGVGKSTISVMIAKQLKALGYSVGILDADITGPSVPRLLHMGKVQAMGTDKYILPVETEDGIKVMSLNLLLDDENKPVIWRGPVISNMVQQFWTDVLWEELDFLIIDMPPGTGDVALTVMQSIPINGLVMVSVPQDLVSMIVTKAIKMAEELNMKILGVIENMSYIKCPDCDKKIKLFNGDGIKEFLKDNNLSLLGELPMVNAISNLSVSGYEEDKDNLDELFEPIVTNILCEL